MDAFGGRDPDLIEQRLLALRSRQSLYRPSRSHLRGRDIQSTGTNRTRLRSKLAADSCLPHSPRYWYGSEGSHRTRILGRKCTSKHQRRTRHELAGKSLLHPRDKAGGISKLVIHL